MAKLPPVRQLKGRALGRILIKMGVLTRDKVHECLKIQRQRGGKVKIGQIFVELGLVSETDLRMALAGQRGMEYVDLGGTEISSEVIEQVPAQMARTYRIIPLEHDKMRNRLTVALDSPDNFRATDDLSTLMGFKVDAKVADEDAIAEALQKYYPEEDSGMSELIGELEGDSVLTEFQGRDQSIDLEELKELAESNPVKKLLNLVLLQAIRDKASDVHFEPFEEEYKMRYRIDGVLYEMVPPPKHIAVALSSRIKVMADLDIAERRLPQDGRIPLVVGGNPIDLRVSVLPTMFGESVVLRILDRTQVDLKLEVLGLRENEIKVMDNLIHKPNGILIVTGPTGSGKTTT
ncbi:MAG: Flp pilus assembly complex ATPase component TadA, partial [Planctomycetes bacterium]|nr:Flp pilus assembly complex ATPase component TadA [Planctomycetota bacterium]